MNYACFALWRARLQTFMIMIKTIIKIRHVVSLAIHAKGISRGSRQGNGTRSAR